jgi:flagellin-like protein
MNSTAAPLTATQRAWVSVFATAITLLAVIVLGMFA